MTEEFKNSIDKLFRNEKFLIYDAELLSLIEEAKDGNPLAWQELYESFLYGNNQQKRITTFKFKTCSNLNIARFFNGLMVDYLKWNLGLTEKQNFTDYQQKKNDFLYLVNEMHEAAIIEGLDQNFETAKNKYIETISMMVNNVEPERWNFAIFEFFKILISEINDSNIAKK